MSLHKFLHLPTENKRMSWTAGIFNAASLYKKLKYSTWFGGYQQYCIWQNGKRWWHLRVFKININMQKCPMNYTFCIFCWKIRVNYTHRNKFCSLTPLIATALSWYSHIFLFFSSWLLTACVFQITWQCVTVEHNKSYR